MGFLVVEFEDAGFVGPMLLFVIGLLSLFISFGLANCHDIVVLAGVCSLRALEVDSYSRLHDCLNRLKVKFPLFLICGTAEAIVALLRGNFIGGFVLEVAFDEKADRLGLGNVDALDLLERRDLLER